MGKYSLENYERYKTIKARPKPLLTEHRANPTIGQFEYVSLSWQVLEPARGEYRLEPIEKALANANNPVFVIVPELPVWVKSYAEDCFAALIRKVGSYMDSDSRLAGIAIETLSSSEVEWNAYMEAFDKLPILADLHDERLISHLRKHNRSFGLLVYCSEQNWITCCEAFAKQGLQSVWKNNPVVLHVEDASCGVHVSREARRWHACLSNRNAGLGYELALRRLTYPEAVSNAGSLPLRFWFTNTGSSRIYKPFDLWVRLQQGDQIYEIQLNAATELWLTGDLIHNEIVHLPNIVPGIYTVSAALFFKDRSYIELNVQAHLDNGYYEVGTITVTGTSEDLLLNAWDKYYPEGYYPLEDPQVPEQQ